MKTRPFQKRQNIVIRKITFYKNNTIKKLYKKFVNQVFNPFLSVVSLRPRRSVLKDRPSQNLTRYITFDWIQTRLVSSKKINVILKLKLFTLF
jgi:hypothetical protein